MVIIAMFGLMFAHSVASNPNWEWDFQLQNAFTPPVLRGVVTTLWLTVAAMLIGVVLGVALAVMRLSPNPVLSGAAWFYVWVFRGTPVLVQLVIWGNLNSLYRQISLGVPFGPEWFTFQTRDLIPPIAAALLGLGLNEAAYMAEIIRAGILSVDEGQSEAASALGLSRMQTLRRIVLPQAMRVVVPPTGNETISMLKTTSLVAVRALRRAVLPDQRHRQPHVPAVPDAGHRQPLVPGDDVGADDRPVLHRAVLLARVGANPATHAGPEAADAPDRGGPAMSAETAITPMVKAEQVHKCFGRLRGAQGDRPRGRPRRGHVHRRALGLGQVDVPALHQPPRADPLRQAVGGR